MGLRSDLLSSIADAFDGDLSDAVKTFTYSHRDGEIFNPITGENTPNIVLYSSRGVFSVSDKDDFAYDQLKGSSKTLTVLKSEIAINPVVGNSVTIDGINYKIDAIESDPADVIWMLKCLR